MTINWPSFTTTPIYNSPAIRFPQSGSIGEIEIPLHITKLTTENPESTVSEITAGMILDPASNLGSGGAMVGYGPTKLQKVVLEGWIDTPATPVMVMGGYGELPNIIIDGYRVTYGEIIAAYFEGRTNVPSSAGLQWGPVWSMTYPKWFRDGYGRVYSSVRLTDFTLQRVEAVPYRNTYTMILQVG